jgi:hypothetical protein
MESQPVPSVTRDRSARPEDYLRSPDNIARVKREFRVGNLYINRKITGALGTASRSAASNSQASAPRRAGRTICCNSSCRARLRRTRCAGAMSMGPLSPKRHWGLCKGHPNAP